MEPPKEIPLCFESKRHEYGDVYTFFFKPLEPVTYEAGQYIHLRVPGVKEGKAVREFSFASAPSEPLLAFSMHVRSQSPYKMRMAELRPGEEVTMFKIKGDFTYPPEEAREVVCIAGGVGVAPFRSMIKEREARGLALPTVLIHVASDGYLFADELETTPVEQHRITRDKTEATIREVVARKPRALYYIAGSPYFTVTVEGYLNAEGILKEHVRRDDFDGYEGEA